MSTAECMRVYGYALKINTISVTLLVFQIDKIYGRHQKSVEVKQTILDRTKVFTLIIVIIKAGIPPLREEGDIFAGPHSVDNLEEEVQLSENMPQRKLKSFLAPLHEFMSDSGLLKKV